MKVFVDRFADLVTIEKPLGRKLRQKKMAAISSSSGDNLGDDFWIPFKAFANYLGIPYLGNVHTIGEADNDEVLQQFIKMVTV